MLMVFSFQTPQEMKEPWLQSGRLGMFHVNPVPRVGGSIAGIDYAMCPTGLRKSRAGHKPNIAACTTVQKCIDACSMHVTHEAHRHFRTWKRSLQRLRFQVRKCRWASCVTGMLKALIIFWRVVQLPM